MKKLTLSLISAFAVLFASCSSDEPKGGQEPLLPGEEYVQYSLTAEETAAAAQLSDFNVNFFRSVAATMPGENLVCSPVSASILLSMMANVAEGEMRNEILNVLGCEDLASLNSLANKTLVELPLADPAATVKFANGLWYADKYVLNPAYEAVAAKYYSTESFGMDFTAKQQAIDAINSWVKNHTNSLIPQILDKLEDDVVAILANAMYFKGAWANPFKVEETKDMPFHGSKGETTVKMMHAREMQHYAEGKDFTAVKMQVGNGALEAVFAMPKDEAVSIDDFIASDALNKACAARYIDEPVDFSFPRFKFAPEENIALNEILEEMGVKHMTTDINLFTIDMMVICRFFQKASIEFTEEGAEGAAVTWVNMDLISPGPDYEPQTPVANFNRPFVFMIRDAATGNMLFAGKITDL